MTKISIPQQALDLAAKEKNLIRAWDNYVEVNKRHINRTLLINETREEKELAFPLTQARSECGKIRIDGKQVWVWDVFFPIYPFFKISQKGSSYTGKISQIIPIKKRFKEILSSTTILEKYFPDMTEKQIAKLPRVPIDLKSLRNYINTTKSYDVHPDLSEPIKEANSEYIQQAQTIIDIVEECQKLGITTSPMLPFKTKKSLFGRTYHLGINLQNCRRHIRKAALGKCWEYDLNGAVIAVKLHILEKIFDEVGGDIDGLLTYSKEYLLEKSKIRQQLADVLYTNRLKRHKAGNAKEPIMAHALSDIKSAFTAISFGADTSTSFWFSKKGDGIQYSAFARIIRNKEDRQIILKARNGFLANFVKEQKEMNQIILDYFMDGKGFKKLIATNPETFGKSRLSKPTVMAYIYQQLEADIIDQIEKEIIAELKADPLEKDKSSPVILKVHDGFYSSRPISKSLLNNIIDKIQYNTCKNTKRFITMSMEKISPWRYEPFILSEYKWKKQKAIYEKEAEGYMATRIDNGILSF